jgi:KTSC domain
MCAFALAPVLLLAGTQLAVAALPNDNNARTEVRNLVISHIPRERVTSNAIVSIGYSKRRHILEVEFANGAIYRYLEVAPSVYRDLMLAQSQSALLRRQYQRPLPISARPPARGPTSELKPASWSWEELRHRFVLTAEEKRVVAFVLAAFILGVGTKCYRDTHPRHPPPIEQKHKRQR